MNIIKTILLTVLVFGIVIFIHEFGHFFTAKLLGVRVNEFALGMGPKLFSFRKGETLYAFRLFPIGGYCAMEGEDETSSDAKAFCNKAVWKRIIIVCAGAFMNIVLGFSILIGLNAASDTLISTTVADFRDDAVSNQSGLAKGDKILAINGASVHVDSDIVYNMMRDKDGIVEIKVLRGGEKVLLPDVQFKVLGEQDGVTEIYFDFKVLPLEKTFLNVVEQSFYKTVSIVRLVWRSVLDLVTGNFSLNQMSGPVGVASQIGQAASAGPDLFLMIIVFITLNLGVFNLLPIPALDGGRLFFLIIEGIRRKPINPKYEGYIHFAGFALLILLMLVVTFNDILRIFR